MKDKLKELILHIVNVNNGIKTISVIMKVMSELGAAGFTTEEYHEAYEELISDGEILRLEFTDPADNPVDLARSKTILFSKGTNFLNLREIQWARMEFQRN